MTGPGAGSPPAAQVPYGHWPSPLGADLAAAGGVRFAGVSLSRDRDGDPLLWWSAMESGANRIWVWSPGAEPRRVGAVESARSRLNEYGGGAFWTHGERLFWVEDSDQRLRTLELRGDPRGEPAVLTPEPPVPRSHRYAAGVVHPGGAWVVVEREVHTGADGRPLAEPVHDLALVRTDASGDPVSLVSGPDFVAAPALSPGGDALAWIQWNHPDMPWDAAELWVGRLPGAGSGAPEGVLDARRVAGGHKAGREPVSVCLPKWDDEGRLWWCDDREDRWVLRRAGEPGVPPAGGGDRRPAFWDGGGEVGVPRWASGGSRFAFCADAAAGSGSSAALVAAESLDGLDRMVVVPVAGEPGAPGSGDGVPPGAPAGDGFDDAEPGWVDMVVGDGEHVAAIAGSPRRPTSVLLWGPPASTAGRSPAPRAFGGSAWPLPEESISLPEAVTFATPSRDDAAVGVAHCLFYPPSLAGFEGLDGELPPLVVRIHGGPTGAARAELSPSVQFWTTRGFAVAEVNYRGSSGYGRAYRNELRGGWGRIEVEDCIAAAEHLADRGRVDRRRCVIRGGSAGGLTALEAVCAPPTASGFRFAAATTLYGVTDLAALAADTHKFESRYLDGLVGPLPGSEQLYASRSPRRHPEEIGSPVLVLQGLEDPVVPPSQAEELVAALARAGIEHEYRTYEGEGHGFRLATTIVDALEAELAFYQRVLDDR